MSSVELSRNVADVVHWLSEPGAPPRAAIVVAVNGDGTLELCIFGPGDDVLFRRGAVKHVRDNSPWHTNAGRWELPARHGAKARVA